MAVHITTLSTELIFQIIDFIRPESHLSFACTCKQFLACSTDVLKRHREAHSKYHVASDRDPATVPTLLRSAFGYGDPIKAWHVRSFEVWRDRSDWTEWKQYLFDVDGLEVNQTSTLLAWEYLYGEVEDYVEPLEYGNSTSELLESARTQIEDGKDGFLKAVLIANCPRLRDVKFVPAGIDQIFDDTASLGWLEIFIKDAVQGRYPWPAGLQSLQSLAVGIPTSTWLDPLPDPQNRESSNDILAALLRLPRIESLYFRNYTAEEDCNSDYDEMLPAGSSTLKHLFMDNCDDINDELRDTLIDAPKDLLTVSFRAGEHLLDHADSIVYGLSKNQGDSLRSMMFYGFNEFRQSRGYRCTAFRPEEMQPCQVLRNVCANIQDFELDAYYNENDKEDGESNAEFLERFFVECFPESMETLNLWDRLSSDFINWEPTDESGLESAVIKMIESDRYENLKAIFLEEIERPKYHTYHTATITGDQESARDKEVFFRKAVEVGLKHGVDVHTITNRNEYIHKIDFPEAPDRADLVSGPWGPRPADWVFNPYSGRREAPGCGKCGDCDKCLRLYTKELWDSLKTA